MKREETKRFSEKTAHIDLKKLERETFKYLYAGIVVAICFHAALVVVYPERKTGIDSTRSIPVELVIRKHRIRRPFPVTQKRASDTYRSRRKSGQAYPSRSIETTSPHSRIDVRHDMPMIVDTGSESTQDVLSDSLRILTQRLQIPPYAIPFKTPVFFDTGIHKSMVIIPPDDKMAIQGYTHIAIGRGARLLPPDYLRTSIQNLAYTLNRHTNIHALADRSIYLYYPPGTETIHWFHKGDGEKKTLENKSAKDIFTYPFIYFTADTAFELTEDEKNNLSNYLRTGGFVILDNGAAEGNCARVEESLKKMVRRAIFEITYDYSFRPISARHPLYHSFFDFAHGAPDGASKAERPIEGIYMGSRLVGFYCPQGYGRAWHDRKNDQQLKFGVNLVVYALSQPRGRYSYNRRAGRPTWTYASSGPIKAW